MDLLSSVPEIDSQNHEIFKQNMYKIVGFMFDLQNNIFHIRDWTDNYYFWIFSSIPEDLKKKSLFCLESQPACCDDFV